MVDVLVHEGVIWGMPLPWKKFFLQVYALRLLLRPFSVQNSHLNSDCHSTIYDSRYAMVVRIVPKSMSCSKICKKHLCSYQQN